MFIYFESVFNFLDYFLIYFFIKNSDEVILLVGNEMIKFEKEICFKMNLI